MGHFNLRVYALIVNEFNEILISDEYRYGQFFSKFPGGGVQVNEGIKEALIRELNEELNYCATEASFYFFNESYQASAFDDSTLIAFYYVIRIPKMELGKLPSYSIPFSEEQEKQRWVKLSELSPKDLTFPIDQQVMGKFLKEDLTIF